MSNAKANMTNEEAMNYGTRMSDRKKTPTEKGKLAFVQSDWKKNFWATHRHPQIRLMYHAGATKPYP